MQEMKPLLTTPLGATTITVNLLYLHPNAACPLGVNSTRGCINKMVKQTI